MIKRMISESQGMLSCFHRELKRWEVESGVLMSASASSIPVVCTNVGSMSEYINDKCGWLVDNNDECIKEIVEKILNFSDVNKLKTMGEEFHEYICKNYSWDKIVDSIVMDCY